MQRIPAISSESELRQSAPEQPSISKITSPIKTEPKNEIDLSKSEPLNRKFAEKSTITKVNPEENISASDFEKARHAIEEKRNQLSK